MGRDQAERDRRRELLEGLALRRTPRMRRQKVGDFRQRERPAAGEPDLRKKRTSVFAEEQDGRRLAGVIGRLPVPGAGGVRRAEGGFHRRARGRGVNTLAAFEMRQQQAGRREDWLLEVRVGGKRSGAQQAPPIREIMFMGKPRGERDGRAARRSLSTAAAQTRPGLTCLSLGWPWPHEKRPGQMAGRFNGSGQERSAIRMDETIRIIDRAADKPQGLPSARWPNVAAVTPHGADDVAGIARPRVEAFHQPRLHVRPRRCRKLRWRRGNDAISAHCWRAFRRANHR